MASMGDDLVITAELPTADAGLSRAVPEPIEEELTVCTGCDTANPLCGCDEVKKRQGYLRRRLAGEVAGVVSVKDAPR